MPGFVYEIAGDARGAVQAFDRTQVSALRVDEAVQHLTGSAYGMNRALQLVDAQTRRFARGQDVLNTMGIRTTAQVQAEITAYEHLARVYRNDALVVAQLNEQKQMLIGRMGGVQRGAMGAQQGLFQLSYALQDATVVGGDFNAIVRATANNVQMLAIGMGLTGPLVLGVTAVVAILPVLVKHLSDTKKEAKLTKEELSGIAGEMLRIKGAQPIFGERTLEEARAYRNELKLQADELQRQLKATTDQRVLAGLNPGQTSTYQTIQVPVLQGPAREKAKEDLKHFLSLYEGASNAVREFEIRVAMAEKARLAGAPVVTRMEERLTEEKDRQKELLEDIAELQGPNGPALRGLVQQNEKLEEQRNRLLEGSKARETALQKERELQEELRGQLRELSGEGAARLVHEQHVTRELQEQIQAAIFMARIQAKRPELLEAQKVLSQQATEQQQAYKEQQARIGEMNEQLQLLRSSEGVRLALLKEQEEGLRRQVELQEQLNRVRAGLPAGIGADQLRQTTPVDGVKSASEGAKDSIQAMQDKMREFGETSAVVFTGFKNMAQVAFGESEAAARKRFEAMKAVSVVEAIVNTAVGVTNALRDKNIPLAIAIGAAGAVQVAAIMATSVGSTGGGRSGGPVHFGGTGSRAPRPSVPGQSASGDLSSKLDNTLTGLQQELSLLRREGVSAHFTRDELRRGQSNLAYRSELTSVRGAD